jgi:hypothetical protein
MCMALTVTGVFLQVPGKAKNSLREEMNEAVWRLMHYDPPLDASADVGRVAAAKLNAFYRGFSDESAFLAYFHAQWGKRIGELASLLKFSHGWESNGMSVLESMCCVWVNRHVDAMLPHTGRLWHQLHVSP